MKRPHRNPHRIVIVSIFAISLIIGTIAAAQMQANGIVFNDKNGNGVRDGKEKGVGKVLVTNGRDVAATDSKGRYTIPVDNDTVISVVKPRGWRTALDKNNVPKGYYIHKLAGSPKSRYKGVDPTGPLPESVDFPLYRQKESDEFKANIIGDTQTGHIKEVEYMAHDVVEELIGSDAKFSVILGDVANNNLDMELPIAEVFAVTGYPTYYVVGNHDKNLDSPDNNSSTETWQRVFGPPTYAFNYGEALFIALDNVHWTGKGYHGEFGEDQLEFMKNLLAFTPEDHLIVVMMHIPVSEAKDRGKFYEILATRPNTLSFSAHWHRHINYFLDEEDGWPGEKPHHHIVAVTACGSWWGGVFDEIGLPHTTMTDGAPNGYMIAEFDDENYQMTFKAARQPAGYQMRIWAPETVQAAETANTEVIANVFDGSEKSKVEMKVGGSEWIPMKLTVRQDPFYLKTKKIDEHFDNKLPPVLGKKIANARDSTHIWTAPLPAVLKPGLHLIKVRATDMYGKTYTGHRTFRIE